jgi:hypothetical protein
VTLYHHDIAGRRWLVRFLPGVLFVRLDGDTQAAEWVVDFADGTVDVAGSPDNPAALFRCRDALAAAARGPNGPGNVRVVRAAAEAPAPG